MRRARRSPPSVVVKMRVGVKPGEWGWPYEELVASWRAAEEEGFAIVSCFDHVSAAPVRVERERPLARAAQVVVRDIDITSGRELLRALEQAGAESVTFLLVAERGPDAVRALAEAVL